MWWARSVSSRSGRVGALPEQHEDGAPAGLHVLGRHEPGEVVHGDRLGGLLNRAQPARGSQARPRVLVDQRRRAGRADSIVANSWWTTPPSASTKARNGSPRSPGTASPRQVALRVGEQRVGRRRLPRQLHRGLGLRVLVVDADHRDPVAVLLVELLEDRHLLVGTGRTSRRPDVDHHRPAQRGEVDAGTAAEAGQRDGGQAAVDRSPAPGRSPRPLPAAFICAQLGGVDVDLRRTRPRVTTSPIRVAARRPARARRRAGQRRPRLMRGPRCCTSLAAASGSVGPAPYAGHQRATGQAPHAGLRAWQTRRPCQIRWWLSIVQSRLGNSAPTACSTLTGSVRSVHPNRRASRPKWVSTVIPGIPKALPRTTLAVLRPTPGSFDQVRRAGAAPRRRTARPAPGSA